MISNTEAFKSKTVSFRHTNSNRVYEPHIFFKFDSEEVEVDQGWMFGFYQERFRIDDDDVVSLLIVNSHCFMMIKAGNGCRLYFSHYPPS